MSLFQFNKKCNLIKLQHEIEQSDITVALSHITGQSVPELTLVYFKAEISEAEETELSSIVSSHVFLEDASDVLNVIPLNEPFSSKVLANGKKLFVRNHGQEFAASSGSNNIDFSIPYAHCKINEMEIINAEIGDKVNFKVLDSSTGTYTTVPYYQLNQFAYNLNVPEKYYKRSCSYDADLYINMIIRIEYTSVSAKTVYFNYVLHEVVS